MQTKFDVQTDLSVSESNNNVWSLVHVPGSEFFDTNNVAHGAVAAITYYSTALGKFLRMHIYTPPGYESRQGKFPVFYLLHGAGEGMALQHGFERRALLLAR